MNAGISGAAFIAGAYDHPERNIPDKPVEQVHAELAAGALADAGLTFADVDGYHCAGDAPEWIEASGRDTICTFAVTRPGRRAYRNATPYMLAYVELAEGPRVMTNIVDCDVDALQIGDAVEVTFHDNGQGAALPRFRPAGR